VSGFGRTSPEQEIADPGMNRLKVVDDFAISRFRDQLARSATGIATNYRATCRARSRAEFLAKLGTVVEEADESQMWLDMVLRLHLAGSGEDYRRPCRS
jgi:four helix bundle protein